MSGAPAIPSLPPASSAGQDPLAQLPPLIEPAAIGYWPPAPGWWLLAITAVSLLMYTLVALTRRYRRLRPYRDARAQVNTLYIDFIEAAGNGGGDIQYYLQQNNALLRRVTMLVQPDTPIQRLHGRAWLEALDDLAGETIFVTAVGDRMLSYYSPTDDSALLTDYSTDAKTLRDSILHWLAVVSRSNRHRTIVNEGNRDV